MRYFSIGAGCEGGFTKEMSRYSAKEQIFRRDWIKITFAHTNDVTATVSVLGIFYGGQDYVKDLTLDSDLP